MSHNTLLVGAHTEGIGDEFAKFWDGQAHIVGSYLHKPTIEDLDVTSEPSIRAYLKEHGPFNEIVYSAGINRLRPADHLTQGLMRILFEVNSFGFPLLMSHHLRLFPNSEGRAVQVISDAAHTPMRNSLAYCSSKAAAEMALRVLAREVFPLWTFTGVNPGVVAETQMSEDVDAVVREIRGWTPEQAEEYEAKTSVLGRRVNKSEVANLIWYALNGPQALNGSIITINGGK